MLSCHAKQRMADNDLFDIRLIRGDEPWKCLVIPHGLVRDDKRKVDGMSFATAVKQKRHRKVA